ncbi:MAG: hypothetical protein BMS9Abin11_0454 [Gammaproteobacteria bacterium]|nr:MAG: hypothetical protein BMS9Abin11_0454 [Gammaproteobacteria bacterium]
MRASLTMIISNSIRALILIAFVFPVWQVSARDEIEVGPKTRSKSKINVGLPFILYKRNKKDNGDDPRDTPPPTLFGEEIDDDGIEIRFRFYTTYEKSGKRMRSNRLWIKAIVKWAKTFNAKCDGIKIKGVYEFAPPDIYVRLNRSKANLTDNSVLERFWPDNVKPKSKAKKNKINRKKLKKNAEKKARELFNPQKEKELAKKEGRKPRKYRQPQKFQSILYYVTDKGAWHVDAEHKSRNKWIVSHARLAKRIREFKAPNVFHLGIFENVWGIPKTGIPGQVLGNVGGLANKPGVNKTDRLHEIGHLFGLGDGDGGIMTKDKKKHRYGSNKLKPWQDSWCGKIKAYLAP